MLIMGHILVTGRLVSLLVNTSKRRRLSRVLRTSNYTHINIYLSPFTWPLPDLWYLICLTGDYWLFLQSKVLLLKTFKKIGKWVLITLLFIIIAGSIFINTNWRPNIIVTQFTNRLSTD